MGEATGDVSDEGLGEIDEALGYAACKGQVPHQDEERDRHQHEMVDALPQRGRQRREGDWSRRKPQADDGRADQNHRNRHAQEEQREKNDEDVPESTHGVQTSSAAWGGAGSRPMSLPTSSAAVWTIINAPPIGTG